MTQARWFLNHEPSVDPPYTTVLPGTMPGKFALDLFHQALVQYHRSALERASTPSFNATAYVAAMRPEMALLSYWGVQTLGYGGAVHSTRPGPMIRVSEVGPTAMAPFGKQRVYVANEAFGALRGLDGVLGGHHGWAECSLVQAENLLVSSAFGLPPPRWVNTSVYEECVGEGRTRDPRRRRFDAPFYPGPAASPLALRRGRCADCAPSCIRQVRALSFGAYGDPAAGRLAAGLMDAGWMDSTRAMDKGRIQG